MFLLAIACLLALALVNRYDFSSAEEEFADDRDLTGQAARVFVAAKEGSGAWSPMPSTHASAWTAGTDPCDEGWAHVKCYGDNVSVTVLSVFQAFVQI